MKAKLRAYVNRKFLLYPKTHQIIELREELYSMMCDKYDDCQSKGLSAQESYKQALTFMEDYRTAIREVETGSALSALRRKLTALLAFTVIYFIVLTSVYLYVSMVTLGSFEKSWLIGVGGTFIYLVCLSASILSYAKMFGMRKLLRIALGCLFLSFIPLLFVFPSLLCAELLSKNVWPHSWLIVPVIVLIYFVTDLILFGKKTRRVYFSIELAAAGTLLTTIIYLFASYLYNLWNIAWIVYLIYSAIAALAFYISRVKKEKALNSHDN